MMTDVSFFYMWALELGAHLHTQCLGHLNKETVNFAHSILGPCATNFRLLPSPLLQSKNKAITKYHLQIGVTQHKNVATPLSTSGINTTRQHFQLRYITLF